MKTEKSPSELWESIKDLYDWRRGVAKPDVRYAYDLIRAGKEAGTEAQREAYRMWRESNSEYVFFASNYFRPDDF